jgi:hypothetical protein
MPVRRSDSRMSLKKFLSGQAACSLWALVAGGGSLLVVSGCTEPSSKSWAQNAPIISASDLSRADSRFGEFGMGAESGARVMMP